MKFNDWFRAQFGPRPAWRDTEELLRKDVERGREAEALLSRCLEWDKKYTAALYGWNVTDEDKRRREEP